MNVFRRSPGGGGSVVWEDMRGREVSMKDNWGAGMQVEK